MPPTLGCFRPSERVGFTLPELLVVLAILAATAALVVPGVGASVTRMAQKSVSEEMVATLRGLQAEAITKGVTLRVDAPELRSRLPGWSEGQHLAVVPPLEYGPTGQASGGVITLSQPDGQSLRWQVDPVTGYTYRLP
jgi:prepilin-type N-terminal cleavage/methylation domain-containing protein